ncbi:MAG: hypothetical protein ABI759_17690 [Candidatus Solibacter sp.]
MATDANRKGVSRPIRHLTTYTAISAAYVATQTQGVHHGMPATPNFHRALGRRHNPCATISM